MFIEYLLLIIIKFHLFIAINATECFWSTYRPGPYFGLRSAQPDSPLFGIMWYYQDRMDSVKGMRHFMEISDNISKYEWIIHNGCDFGSLKIEDPTMNIILNINFYGEQLEKGNHWIVNISGKNLKEDPDKKGLVLMWYVTNPNKGPNIFGINYDINNSTLSGIYKNKDLENKFYIKNIQSNSNKHPSYKGIKYENEFYIVMNISEDKLYDPSEYIIGELKDIVGNTPNHLIDTSDSYRSAGITKGNVFVQQLFLIEDFRSDIHFFDNIIDDSKLNENEVDLIIRNKTEEFHTKFYEVFERNSLNHLNCNNNLKNNFLGEDFISSSLLDNIMKTSIEILQLTNKNNFTYHYNNKIKININYTQQTAISALSTLFSNLIYMNGQMHILDMNSSSIILYPSSELLTIGPDKTSHSRGFMWDEGFQQRILSLWNIDLSLKVLTNWFSNIDPETGWLGREQSLDNESRARAPPSSWASIPGVSNPPSLFLFIKHLIERQSEIKNNINKDKSDLNKVFRDQLKIRLFLKNVIEKIEKNAQWYITSQKSQGNEYVFSWKGKTDDFCLPSGLDDYPRCRLNGKNLSEGHIDLQSWMISLAKTMIKIYKFLDEEEYAIQINFWNKTKNNLFNALKELFWDNDKMQFSDFYFDENNNKIFGNHTGYLNMFPLILDNFEDEDLINLENQKFILEILDLIINKNKGLRTNFGIRSLSIFDEYYKKGQNYWSSPIWININYLILKKMNEMRNISKFSYLSNDYEIIRNDIVENMVRNFQENGYIWEVYDDVSGEGKYNHPFTGWSALIINLIYEIY